MNDYHVQAVLIDEEVVYQMTELTSLTGLDATQLLELMECELLGIERCANGGFRCSSETYIQARRAARVAHDFELGPEALALAVQLLREIDLLQDRIAMMARPGR